MFIHKKISFYFLLLAATLFSCSKQKGFGPKSDVIVADGILVQNAADYRPEPTVTTSITGGGNIQIVLSLSANSKRSIKEITKVAASTAFTKIQSSDASGFYTTVPITASGASVTFTTTLTEYFTKFPASASNPAAKQDTELALRFYFKITLDDGSVIIARPVRVLVLA